MWLGTYKDVSFQLGRYRNGRIRFEPMPLPSGDGSLVDCAVDYEGNVWIAMGDVGLFQRAPQGSWSRFPVADPEHDVYTAILPDARGRILLAYRGSMVKRIDFPDFSTIWNAPGASFGRLQWLARDGEDIYLIGQNGIARVRGNDTVVVSRTKYPELRGITGMARSHGHVWLMSAAGVLRASAAEFARAFDQPGSLLRFSVLDMKDGLPGTAMLGGQYHAVAGGDGRLWFVTREGLARVDPGEIRLNQMPPPVMIEAVTADGRREENPGNLRMARGVSSLELDYTALSLTAPERVRFRYRLEGVDDKWVDAGARREAFYTSLAPGRYSFHVIAANEDGVWNNEGARLELESPPTFVQSLPFRIACAVAVLALLWLLYSLRLRTIAGRLHMAASARLNERERIARELHDTLLQGFQGLTLLLQAIARRVESEPEKVQRLIEQALERADSVLEEGRDRVKDLRVSDRMSGDLSQLFIRVAEEAQPHTTRVRVTVEGNARALDSLVGDEIAKVGTEAITNVFLHARASTLDVDIVYQHRQFTLRISDDGIGIDPAVLSSGRDGHFGLRGMRERARNMGGSISIASRPDSGTAIELSVPAPIAYVGKPRGLMRWWLGRAVTARTLS
jgi:signal transduction histidine kinase